MSRQRTRRVVRWTGAVLFSACILVWLASASWKVTACRWNAVDSKVLRLYGGSIRFYWFDQPLPLRNPSPYIEICGPGFRPVAVGESDWRWFEWSWSGAPNVTYVAVPIWAPGLALLVLSAIVSGWLGRAEQRAGACRKCGYSREGGDPSSKCPECGAEPRRSRRRAPRG